MKTLDARGLYCPEPVMMLHSKMDELVVDELLEVLATDPSTQRDINRFCQFLGHELLEMSEQQGEYRFVIKKVES